MQPPVLERIGVGYLRRRAPAVRADGRGAERTRTHVLTDDEQRGLRVDFARVEARARAFVAGQHLTG